MSGAGRRVKLDLFAEPSGTFKFVYNVLLCLVRRLRLLGLWNSGIIRVRDFKLFKFYPPNDICEGCVLLQRRSWFSALLALELEKGSCKVL